MTWDLMPSMQGDWMSPGGNSPELPSTLKILTLPEFAGLWHRQTQSGSQNGVLPPKAPVPTTHPNEDNFDEDPSRAERAQLIAERARGFRGNGLRASEKPAQANAKQAANERSKAKHNRARKAFLRNLEPHIQAAQNHEN